MSAEVLMQEGVVEQLGIDNAQNAVTEPITTNEDEHTENVAEGEETDIEEIGLSEIPCHAVFEDDDAEAAQRNAFKMQAPEEVPGKCDFHSDSSSDNERDNNEDVDQPLVAPEPLLDGDMANSFGNIKICESAEQDNEVGADCIAYQPSSKKAASDNQPKFQICARSQLGTLQDENMSAAATGTPIEKKSPRPLK